MTTDSTGDWTPARIEEVRERCEKATPGPWTVAVVDHWTNDTHGERTEIRCPPDPKNVNGFDVLGWGDGPETWDTTFVAHAREDLPAALAEIERRGSRATVLQGLVDSLGAENKRQAAEIERMRARPTLTEEQARETVRETWEAAVARTGENESGCDSIFEAMVDLHLRAARGETGEPSAPRPGSGVLVPHPANVLATRAALEAALHDPETAEGAAALLADLEAP